MVQILDLEAWFHPAPFQLAWTEDIHRWLWVYELSPFLSFPVLHLLCGHVKIVSNPGILRTLVWPFCICTQVTFSELLWDIRAVRRHLKRCTHQALHLESSFSPVWARKPEGLDFYRSSVRASCWGVQVWLAAAVGRVGTTSHSIHTLGSMTKNVLSWFCFQMLW